MLMLLSNISSSSNSKIIRKAMANIPTRTMLPTTNTMGKLRVLVLVVKTTTIRVLRSTTSSIKPTTAKAGTNRRKVRTRTSSKRTMITITNIISNITIVQRREEHKAKLNTKVSNTEEEIQIKERVHSRKINSALTKIETAVKQ